MTNFCTKLFYLSSIEMESEETGHTITLSEGISTDDLIGTATVNQSKNKIDTKV